MIDNLYLFSGKAWKFGDNISTDHILPSRFMTQIEPHELAASCMAGANPEFSKKVKPGDILVAGLNIGYGSSREQAPTALKCAGISAVIAKTFARIFYRNCYNIGLPAITCSIFVEEVSEKDEVEIHLSEGVIRNRTTGKNYKFIKPPDFLMEYIKDKGLIPYLKRQLTSNRKGKGV